MSLLSKYPQLVVVRTLSKAYALAGIRVGYAAGEPQIVELLDRVRDSYNVNRLSQAAAMAALADQGYYTGIIEKLKASGIFMRENGATAFVRFVYPRSRISYFC